MYKEQPKKQLAGLVMLSLLYEIGSSFNAYEEKDQVIFLPILVTKKTAKTIQRENDTWSVEKNLAADFARIMDNAFELGIIEAMKGALSIVTDLGLPGKEREDVLELDDMDAPDGKRH